MKHAVIALANGFEEVEALTGVDLLRRAGVDVTLAAVGESLTIVGGHHIPVTCDAFFQDVPLADMDMLILPGGRVGTDNLEADEVVMGAIDTFNKEEKYIAAICAAPAVLLGKHGYLRGREATCYPGMEELFVEAEHRTKPVVVGGHIITSRGVGTSMDFACAMVEKLCGIEKATEVAASVVYSYPHEA